MATLDIRGAIVGETATAIKAPCLVATTGGNIALSGVQSIDGVLVGNNSRTRPGQGSGDTRARTASIRR